jgi:excinuclease UvrABC nuclease subunit
MKVNNLIPNVSNRVQFTLKYRKFVPKESGCYVLTTFEGVVLYVGLSDNLNRRFSNHREVKEKCKPTSQGMAFWFYYLLSPMKEINRIERSWLNQHTSLQGTFPILNKISSPVK